MATITDSDISINAAGGIRWASNNTTTHTVLEFIQWLMDKQDDAQAAGDDLLDITVDTPFNRSTDQIMTLNAPFNIDDNLSTHFFDGSISQTDPIDGQETLYSGLAVIGPVEAGTEYQILQDGKLLSPFWGTGINAEASPSLVFSRHLVKSKHAGIAIDGQRATVLARELGDQFRRFPVTLGTANSVAAIGNGSDLFNAKTDATLAGYFGTVINTEGFQDLDIEGTGTTYEFFSQWADGGQSTNDVYEYTKWISQRASVTPSYGTYDTHTGAWEVVDNATIQGCAQEIVAPANLELLVAVKVKLRFQGTRATHTGNVYAELYDSDDASPAIPTGAILGRSQNIPISRIQNDTAGEDIFFQFDMIDPTDGSDQRDTMDMTAAQTYFIAIRHDEGDATEYLEIDADATTPAGTEFVATWGGATWTGDATVAYNMEVYSAPEYHGIAGDRFEGINVDVGFDAETGDVPQTLTPADAYCLWGTDVTYDNLVGGPFFAGELAQIWTTSGKTVFVGGCTVLYDDLTSRLIVAQDTVSSLVTDYYIEGVDSGANCLVNVTLVDNDKSGGTGIVLAKDDDGTSGELYVQIISGSSPVENSIVYSSGTPLSNFITASATVNARTLSPEFLGTSTGSNIIGAYGQCFLPADVGSSDTFFDLGAGGVPVQRTPPNNQTFTVSGLVAGEDRVLVAPRTGTAINTTQLATDVLLNGAAETLIQCSAVVPNETPATGSLRVTLDSGINKRVRYESNAVNDYTMLAIDTFAPGDVDITDGVAGNSVNIAAHNFVTLDKVQLTSATTLPAGLSLTTDYWIINYDANNIQFAASKADAIAGTDVDITDAGTGTHTITPWSVVDGSTEAMADFSGDPAASTNNVFLTYIDVLARTTSESYTAKYTGDRDLFVRVRDGGATPIKTFESDSAQFLSTPQTVAAVRTNDY